MAHEDRHENAARTAEDLTEEHRHIHDLVTRLQEAGSREAAVPVLDELHGVLVRHFAHEQYPGGFYETLGACTPVYRDDLRVLIDQHFVIISAVEGLRQRARRAVDAEWPALRTESLAIVDELGAHEARERDLVSRLLRR